MHTLNNTCKIHVQFFHTTFLFTTHMCLLPYSEHCILPSINTQPTIVNANDFYFGAVSIQVLTAWHGKRYRLVRLFQCACCFITVIILLNFSY